MGGSVLEVCTVVPTGGAGTHGGRYDVEEGNVREGGDRILSIDILEL